MKPVVLDASVIIKWIKPENENKLNEAHDYFLEQLNGSIQVHSPSIFLYEIHNIIARTSSQRPPMLLDFLQSTNITIVEPTNEIITISYELFDKYHITFYDASYIALARVIKCDLITADKKLVDKVSLSYVKLLS